MKRDNWIVTNYSVRPAGKSDECFYCKKKLGEEHALDCVIRSRTVIVDFTIRMVTHEPENWDKEQIEFHYNEGSWCSDNFLDDLERRSKKMGCSCDITDAKFVREATEEDENNFGTVFVKEFES